LRIGRIPKKSVKERVFEDCCTNVPGETKKKSRTGGYWKRGDCLLEKKGGLSRMKEESFNGRNLTGGVGTSKGG